MFKGTGVPIVFVLAAMFLVPPALAAGADTAGAAGTQVVYPGCAAPSTSAGHVYYVDPRMGSPLGDGSRLHPWRALSEVVAAGLFSTMPTHYDNTLKITIRSNPNAPIKPGDTIYLMSGNHGSVLLQGYFGVGTTLSGYNNSNFITIAAYPGQTPIIENLKINGGNKWVFQGITFQSTNPTSTSPNEYGLVHFVGPHADIVFRNNILQSQNDASGWSITDWQQKRASGVGDIEGQCIAITGNTIRNIGYGIASQRSNGVLISGNTIDHFTDDGIDYGSNYMLIQGNRITNSIEDGDGIHRDGMQGQPYLPYSGTTVVSNVAILHNTVIRLTDPNLRYPGSLQGIDTFDGVWNNVTVTDNVVITNAWHGISFYGVQNASLSNNIVLADNGKTLPCYGLQLAACLTKSVVYDTTAIPWILVAASKFNMPSSNVTVTGNIVTTLKVDVTTVAPAITGNTCVSTNGKCTIGIPVAGKEMWYGKPGTYTGNNVITTVGAAGFFMNYDPVHEIYDLRLRPGAH